MRNLLLLKFETKIGILILLIIVFFFIFTLFKQKESFNRFLNYSNINETFYEEPAP